MIELNHDDLSQKSFLVGDLYHWELDKNGYFFVAENSRTSLQEESARGDPDFKTFNIAEITENIQDC